MRLDHLKEEEECAHEELERDYNTVNRGKKRVHDWDSFSNHYISFDSVIFKILFPRVNDIFYVYISHLFSRKSYSIPLIIFLKYR